MYFLHREGLPQTGFLCLFFFLFVLQFVVATWAAPGFGSAKRVVLIGADGLGGQYLEKAQNLTGFQRLQQQGSWTYNARASVPTVSLPNWSGMFTGLEPESSGVFDNAWTDPSKRSITQCKSFGSVEDTCVTCAVCRSLAPTLQTSVKAGASKAILITLASQACTMLPDADTKELCSSFMARARRGEFDDVIERTSEFLKTTDDPSDVCSQPYLPVCRNGIPSVEGMVKPKTLFKVIKDTISLLKVSFFTDWGGIRFILEEEAIDTWAVYGDYNNLTRDFTQAIRRDKPDVMFIHYDACDHAGQTYGFGSNRYFDAIKFVDRQIGLILDALTSAQILDETLVILTADHGGYAKIHEYLPPKIESVRIPFFAMGPGVKSNNQISTYVRNLDMPATALYGLGIKPPAHWNGRALVEIYDSVPQNVAASSVENVILIGIGGLRASALSQTKGALNLQQLITDDTSSYTLSSRVTAPILSLPNWQSIISGAGPEEHGVTTDEWPSSPFPPASGDGEWFPSIFHLLKERDSSFKLAALYSQANLSRILDDYILDLNYQSRSNDELISKAVDFLARNTNKKLLFLELDDPETAGIQYGFFSKQYYNAVEQADRSVGQFLTTLREKDGKLMDKSVIFIVGNHGGSNAGECAAAECLLVPLIVHGNAAEGNPKNLGNFTRIVDVAPSIALSLGVAPSPYWTGKGMVFQPIQDSSKSNGNKSKKAGIIAAAVLVPTVFLIAAGFVAFFLYKKRLQRHQDAGYSQVWTQLNRGSSPGVELDSIDDEE